MAIRDGAATAPKPRLSRQVVHCALAALLPAALPAATAEKAADPPVEFNSAFLQGGGQVDVSRFSRSNPVLAGEYLIDLQFNRNWLGRASIRFVSQPGSDTAAPCLDFTMIERLGLDYGRLSPSALAELHRIKVGGCADLQAMIVDSTVSFDLSLLRLEISVPQAALLRKPRGYVGPEFWDSGVTSATLGYNLSAYRTATSDVAATKGHLDLTTGINLGSWHLRQRSSVDVASGAHAAYQHIAAYLAHDIPALSADLTIGDSFTDGAVFDSFGFRGASLASNDRMLPDSQLEYAPVVRGIAHTNARVVITQNGVTILETAVSPGAFEIDDLYATGYGGDLRVVINEADGRQESFTVPYASMVQLLRPGLWRYTAAAGTLQQASGSAAESFAQMTLQHGFNSPVTGYAGAMGAEHYQAGQLGMALNTPLGALLADVTQAEASFTDGSSFSGRSLRLGYSKLFPDTRTNISMAAYRFASSGFYSFSEVQAARQAARAGSTVGAVGHARSQWQISVNQTLPGQRGNFYLTASVRDYWHSSGQTTQLQGGYTNRLRLWGMTPSYSIAIAHVTNVLTGRPDNQFQASFSLPLGHSVHSPMLSTSFRQNSTGGLRTRAGQEVITGAGGRNNQLSYSLSASQASGGNSWAASGQYRGAYASMSASMSEGNGFSQQSLGATGGMVFHPGGVTLSNQMTDTIGIVEAKGAEGARVTNSIGAVINHSGYAVLPYLLPYRMNSIGIDSDGAVSQDVEFRSTTEFIAPRQNSVVMIRFETVSGRAVLISTRLAEGSRLPFGASVYDAGGGEVGLAGQDGRIYLRGIAEAGTLTARWGDAPDQQCGFSYQLPPQKKDDGLFTRIDAVCRVELAAPGRPDGKGSR